MAAHVTGTLVTVPLNYALIFGHFGVPALGIWGAALGTIGRLRGRRETTS